MISALEASSDRAITQGKLSQNYFTGLGKNIKPTKKLQQLAEEAALDSESEVVDDELASESRLQSVSLISTLGECDRDHTR